MIDPLAGAMIIVVLIAIAAEVRTALASKDSFGADEAPLAEKETDDEVKY